MNRKVIGGFAVSSVVWKTLERCEAIAFVIFLGTSWDTQGTATHQDGVYFVVFPRRHWTASGTKIKSSPAASPEAVETPQPTTCLATSTKAHDYTYLT
jgi:hypothetical protein